MPPTLCIVQTNPTAGDLQHNASALLQATRTAYAQGARLLLTGHMALCGAPLHDLAQLAAFTQACTATLQDMAAQLADLPDLWLITSHSHGIALLHQGQVTPLQTAPLQAAPLQAAPVTPCLLELPHLRLALLLATDADETSTSLPACPALAGAQLLCVLAASPWHMGKTHSREQHYSALAQRLRMPILYSNIVGGQDASVYDGGSFALQANGALAGRARSFASDIWHVQIQAPAQSSATTPTHSTPSAPLTLQASTTPSTETPTPDDATLGLPPCQQSYNRQAVWQALVLGLRDYVRKSGFKHVALGLSGGIDSALVLALAVDALGREQVQAVMMPSPYTADISLADARTMASKLGVRYHEIAISPALNALQHSLQPLLASSPSLSAPATASTPAAAPAATSTTTAENLQARIRGTLLMALSNQTGALVLACGNKSELATGYCTLYGDMAGGFAPIKDVLKTQVYALARWRNTHNPFGTCEAPIPERIITRAPSAELRPEQTDQDSLPPYDVLDAIVLQYVEHNLPAATLLAHGLPAAAVQQVTRLIHANEYKRAQAAPGTRISRRAFGQGWHYPQVNRYRQI